MYILFNFLGTRLIRGLPHLSLGSLLRIARRDLRLHRGEEVLVRNARRGVDPTVRQRTQLIPKGARVEQENVGTFTCTK